MIMKPLSSMHNRTKTLIFIRKDFQHFFYFYMKNKSVQSLIRYHIYLICLETEVNFAGVFYPLQCSQFRIMLHYLVKCSSLKLPSIEKLLLSKTFAFLKRCSVRLRHCAASWFPAISYRRNAE